MIDQKETPPGGSRVGAGTQDEFTGRGQANGSKTNWQGETDIFAEAREAFDVPALWQILNLPGEPRPSCRSPFRADKSPSFSIFDGGRAWRDHATGDGGSVIDFLMAALDCDLAEARRWFAERLGIDRHDHRRDKPPEGIEGEIRWPGELVTGTSETWEAFAKRFGISSDTAEDAVQRDLLRFVRIKGNPCFVVTDSERRCAEIRRCDGKEFRPREKAYRLTNAKKRFPINWPELKQRPAAPVFITEGATDFLAALDLHCRWNGETYVLLAILGAQNRNLDPQVKIFMRGRRVRLCPDGDDAGRVMAEHFETVFSDIGCTVETLNLPEGEDIRSLHQSGAITPNDLFQ